MPKRKLSKEDVSRIQKKIRKLQKKLNSVSSDTSSDLEEVPPLVDCGADTPTLRPSDWIIEDEPIDDNPVIVSVPVTQPDPITLTSSLQARPSGSDSIPETNMVDKDTGLDSDVLEILGEDPSNDQKYGPAIRSELANRINHISTEGLSKELRKDLITKYPTPSNCTQIDAPKLNIEIKAAILEAAIKRDKGIETKQKQMASAIACLSGVIDTHIVSKSKNNELLQKLMDINRILCDLQHADSVTRRNLILFSLKYDMKKHLKNTKIDSFLFGEDLPETLKSAIAVNKSSADLKPEQVKPTGSKRYNPAGSKPLALNRRAPAQARRMPAASSHTPIWTRSREIMPRYHTTLPPPPPPAHTSRLSHQQRGHPPPPQCRRY